MIEPTETEPKRELDLFADAMISIAHEVEEKAEIVKSAPHLTRIARVDEVTAARRPILRWKKPAEAQVRAKTGELKADTSIGSEPVLPASVR